MYQLDLTALSETIKDHFPEIPFVFLFGSAKNGIVNEGSDIDIAFWYKGNNELIKLDLLRTIEPFAKGIEIDLINLNGANPILAHEALSGKILYLRQGAIEFYATYYTRVATEYEDRMYWMKKQLEYRNYEVQWSY